MPVTIDVTGALEAALLRWFDISQDSFRQWARATDFTVADEGDGTEDANDLDSAE